MKHESIKLLPQPLIQKRNCPELLSLLTPAKKLSQFYKIAKILL